MTNNLMKDTQSHYTYHAAESRGGSNHGWLNAKHSFSFAGYYNPERINFGKLRVLNDDVIAPSRGFATHPHDNMEIITIALKGALGHSDDMGNSSVIRPGEVQIMSAGTGIKHSEANASNTEDSNILQIWVFPKEYNIKPRYDQKLFDPVLRKNNWQVVVSPTHSDALWINQDAFFSLLELEKGKTIDYEFHLKENGVYLFAIEGELSIDNTYELKKRDALGVHNTDKLTVRAIETSFILAIEVPMIL